MPVDLQDALKRATSLESFMEILNVPEQSDINIKHREGLCTVLQSNLFLKKVAHILNSLALKQEFSCTIM